MPIPFVAVLITAILSAGAAALAGRTAAAIAAAVAAGCLVVWLVVFLRVSAPINRVLISAAVDHRLPADARALQRRWDRVLYVRLALHTLALAALCTALASP